MPTFLEATYQRQFLQGELTFQKTSPNSNFPNGLSFPNSSQGTHGKSPSSQSALQC